MRATVIAMLALVLAFTSHAWGDRPTATTSHHDQDKIEQALEHALRAEAAARRAAKRASAALKRTGIAHSARTTIRKQAMAHDQGRISGFAPCNRREAAVGGGYRLSENATDADVASFTVTATLPTEVSGREGWFVEARMRPESQPMLSEVFVMCDR